MQNISDQLKKYPRTPRTKELNTNTFLGPRSPSSTQDSTDRIADWLCEKFKSPDHRPFFLKAAWRLDEGTIHRLAGLASEAGRNPRAYFIVAARREISKRQCV